MICIVCMHETYRKIARHCLVIAISFYRHLSRFESHLFPLQQHHVTANVFVCGARFFSPCMKLQFCCAFVRFESDKNSGRLKVFSLILESFLSLDSFAYFWSLLNNKNDFVCWWLCARICASSNLFLQHSQSLDVVSFRIIKWKRFSHLSNSISVRKNLLIHWFCFVEFSSNFFVHFRLQIFQELQAQIFKTFFVFIFLLTLFFFLRHTENCLETKFHFPQAIENKKLVKENREKYTSELTGRCWLNKLLQTTERT